MACNGILKSQGVCLCRDLDDVADNFLTESLDSGSYPCVLPDALPRKVREGGRIVNVSVIAGTGVDAAHPGEVLGMAVAPVGTALLAGLPEVPELSPSQRGGRGHLRRPPRVEPGDRHGGWLATVSPHFIASLPTRAPKCAQPGVSTTERTIYQQLSPGEVHGQLDRVVEQLQEPFPQVA